MAIKSKVAIEVEIKNIKRVADLKKELKDLRKEQKEAEKQAKTGQFTSKKQEKQYIANAKAIGQKSKSLRGLNKNLRESTKDTTKSTKASNGMAKQFVKGAAAIGILVGAFRAVNRAVSAVITTFTEYEFVMAKVNAVSGATDEEFKALDETAKELGRTTFFTAAQVGELQLAFSKLGFTAQEIQDAVKPTLDLATATGSDLARAAQVAGAAVRGFGLDASETQRVVDVMAVSFASSAMDIEKWSTSMTKVAPIAKSAGFSIEDTAAIMSKLTDSGIEASIAGTSLRNILLHMQDPSSDLTKSFGRTIHGLDDLVPAMKRFIEEGGSMADVMEVVDRRQAAAFEQMLTTADGTVELRNALLDANGEGERMALIVGDTLQGALLKFTSASQGFAIAFMENFSGSIQNGFEKAAEFINKTTESASAIAKFIERLIQVAKFIGIYKGVLIATTVATAAFELATGKASMSTKRFMVSFRGLTATMLANPYVAVGALLIALATDLFNLRHEVNETDDSWEKMNQTIKGDISAYETRQKIIGALKGELASVQDLQRAKIAMIRIDEELEASAGSREAQAIQLRKNATEMGYTQDLIDSYVALGLQDFDRNVQLKERQKQELKTAMAIAKTTVSTREGTSATTDLGKAIKELPELDPNFISEATRDAYVGLMNEVIDGNMKMADAEQELFNFRVELLENLLKDESLSYDEKMKLEEMLVNEKMKNAKKVEKANKNEQKDLKKTIKEYGDLGGALQDVAGDSDALNGVREAGIAISKAAAIAESILTLEKTLGLVTEGKLTIATLLGASAKTAEATATGVSAAATAADTVVTGANTAVTGVNTAVTAAGAVTDTAAIVPAVALGAAKQTKLPFPLNLIAVVATLALLAKIMGKFEKGGIISNGNKFADGGMVHGPSHAQGGVKFAVGGRVNELEGGEAVINKRSTAMFRGQLSAMNEAGGGVKFADGGLLNSPQFANQQFSSGMQRGAGMQKVYVVESDITSSQRTVDVLESNATI